MLCFTTLSEISTNYSYFERYQNAWDVMITLKDTDIEKFNMTQQIQEMDEVKSATVYQKSEGITYISNEMESESLIAHGGLGNYISSAETENGYAIKTPIVILDDASFQEYCNQIGISDSLNGTVILNRIWDSQNSNFRDKEYIQFINENKDSIVLYPSQESNIKIEVPIISYTTQAPELREEYDNYSLVNFVSLSTWNQYLSQFDHSQSDSYIRIFSKEMPTLDSLNKLENKVVQFLDKQYLIESENRIKEKNTNDEMTQGMVTILGGFCILLATIGIANVFLNSLGFIRQRKREFAQYMSIGLTPKEMKKMLSVEALVISGKPIIISLVLTVVIVQFMIRASYLESNVFWSQAPVIPMILFAVFIVGTVATAFYIGGKRILKADLTEALKSDI